MIENKQLYEKVGNDYKPINPIVALASIIDTVGDKSLEYIINNYNHLYIEYKNDIATTRSEVPTVLRKNGLFITYNNGKKIVTEFYKGNNVNISKDWLLDSNWEIIPDLEYIFSGSAIIPNGSILPNHLSPALKELLGSCNTINNLPDEEDLTTDGFVLRLKDREYDEKSFSGLGKIILRKNIKVIDGAAYNVLTQDMINEPNTIYEIRYDFDLNGGEITIPEGCVLDFQGGSFSNGAIVGNNTSIVASLFKIFNINVNILGTWNVDRAYPEWFGAKADKENYDSRLAIQKTIDSFKHTVLNGVYYVLSADLEGYAIKMPEGRVLEGIGGPVNLGTHYDKAAQLYAISSDIKTIVGISLSNEISNLYIRGNYNISSDIVGISHTIDGSRKHTLRNVNISNCYAAIDAQIFSSNLEKVTFYYNKRGIHLYGNDKAEYTSIVLNNCGGSNVIEYGFYLERLIYSSLISCSVDFVGYNESSFAPNNNLDAAFILEKCRNVSMVGCGSEHCVKSLSIKSSVYCSIELDRFFIYEDAYAPYVNRNIFFEHSSSNTVRISNTIHNLPNGTKTVLYSHYTKHNSNLIKGISIADISYYNHDSENLSAENLRKGLLIDAAVNIETNAVNGFIIPSSINILTSTLKYNISNSNVYTGADDATDYYGMTELIIEGTSWRENYFKFDLYKTKNFNGFKKISFRNIRIDFGDYSAAYYLTFKNTFVVFENCVIVGGGTSDFLFNCINSTIIMNNSVVINPKHQPISNVQISANLNIKFLTDSGLSSVDTLTLPSGSEIILSDNTSAVNVASNIALYTIRQVASESEMNDVFATFTDYEKSKLKGSSCFVGTKMYRWNGSSWE